MNLVKGQMSDISNKKIAVYAGSFDPPTKGHLWIIEKSSEIFDEVIVAVGTNPSKNYKFSEEERIEMVKKCVEKFPNVKVMPMGKELLVNFCKKVNAKFIVRGIRNESDYEYERTMRYVNEELKKDLVTIFLIPPLELTNISSSFVKSLVGFKNWEKIVKKYLPKEIYKIFIKKWG